MNVFVSWSGDLSKKLASTLNDWLPTVIQATKPFFSPDDIKKGEFWTGRLKDELKSNSTGILCITHENQDAPWILFEAGALTNSIGKGKVCPLLFNMEITDLKGPLSLFNATQYSKEEIRKLLKSINSDLDDKLDDKVLDKVFEKMWTEFDSKIKGMLEEYKDKIPKKEKTRPDSDMIKEILILQRESSRRNAMYQDRILRRIESFLFELNERYSIRSSKIHRSGGILDDKDELNVEQSKEQIADDIYDYARSLGINVRAVLPSSTNLIIEMGGEKISTLEIEELNNYAKSKGYNIIIK